MAIETKIATVLDEHTVVLPVGRNKGVSLNDVFKVYALGQMINDPDSGEPLEQVIIQRGMGRVTGVQEKICVIEAFVQGPGNFSVEGTKRSTFSNVKVGDIAEHVDRLLSF